MNQLKVGTIISYTSLGINILTGIFYTPWMIHSIGQDNYGLYILALSVISLFTFDFGLSSAVTRFIARYLAMKRQDLADNCLGLVYKLYISIDIILFLGLILVYFFIPQIYEELTFEEIEKFKVVYSIAAIFSVLSFPFIPVNGILTAHEKIIQLKIADVLQKIFIVVAMSICLFMGLGLYALVIINALGGLVSIVYKLWCIRKFTHQRVSWNYSSKAQLKELATYSGWVTVIALSQRLIFNIAPTILGITSGAAPIAILGVAMTIEGYCFTFASALNGIFLPKVTRILMSQNNDILPLMIKVGRIQLIVVGFIIAGFICYGFPFIHLWVGENFKSSYLCAVLIMLPSIIHLPQTIGIEAIYARNKVKELAFVFIIMAVCNIIGAIVLSPHLGAIGICISVCMVYLLRTIGLDYILIDSLKVNILKYFRITFLPLLPCIAIASCFGILFRHLIYPQNWAILISEIVIFSAIYFWLLYYKGMNEEERNLIISPLRKILNNR